MGQLLALALLLVAFATLFFVNVFNRRFRVWDQRFIRTEQDINALRDGQRTKAEEQDAGRGERPAKPADDDLATRYRSDWQSLTTRQRQLKDETAQVTGRLDELSESLQTTLRDHGTRLDALDRLVASLGARGDAPEAAEIRTEIDRQAASLRELRGEVAQASEQTTQELTGLREQLAALGDEVHLLDADRQDLRAQLRKWLDHSAHQTGQDPAASIMPGFVAAGDRAAAELLPGLYEAVLAAVGLEPVFREHAGTGHVFYYLAWRHPGGQSPRRRLEDLLAASPDGDASADGLTEFRSLLLALRTGGTGTVRLGPLVVGQTAAGAFQGAVMSADEAAELDQGDLGATPGRWADRLAGLDEDRVVNLSGWATGHLA